VYLKCFIRNYRNYSREKRPLAYFRRYLVTSPYQLPYLCL